MSRRVLKMVAVSYAVKTALVVAVWLAAPDLVRQGREKAVQAWGRLTRSTPAAEAAIATAAPHAAAGAAVRPAGTMALPPGR